MKGKIKVQKSYKELEEEVEELKDMVKDYLSIIKRYDEYIEILIGDIECLTDGVKHELRKLRR